MPNHEQRILIIACVVVGVDSANYSLILPVLPTVLIELGVEGMSEAAVTGGLLVAAFAVFQLLFSPLLGACVDRYGRKPMLMGALVVLALDHLVLVFAETVWVLFIARFLAGIGLAAGIAVSAMVADVTAPADRARRFALLAAAAGIGFAMAPGISGLIAQFGSRAPFVVAAGVTTILLLVTYLTLNETLPKTSRQRIELRRCLPFVQFKNIDISSQTKKLLIMLFAFEMTVASFVLVWPYFTPYAFGWNVQMVGLSLSLVGIGMIVTHVVGLPLFQKVASDGLVLILSMTLAALTLFLLSSTSATEIALALIVVLALCSISDPLIYGFLSSSVPLERQGELQGLCSTVGAIAALLSPLIFPPLFGWSTDGTRDFPGMALILGAAFAAFGAVWAFFLDFGKKQ